MSSFIRGTPNLKYTGTKVLADALGMGIGNGINTYYANKALESVVNDPNLRDAPTSQKMGALNKALSPYGKTGQDLLKNKLMEEQQFQQEQEQKTNLKKGDILRRRLNNEEVSEKELGMFTPEEELAIAKHKQTLDIANVKAANKTQPLSTQPVSPEQLSSIDKAHATPGYEDMTESEKYDTLIHNNVSTDNAIKEATLRKEQAVRENKQSSEETKQVSDSFKENEGFINQTYDKYEDTLRKEAITDRMIQIEGTGETSKSGVINTLEALGLQPEWLKNPANEEYNKLGLDLLGGGTLQADYGSRVLASEFKVSQQRIPSLMQTPEGRRQITENIRTMILPSKLKQEKLQEYLDDAEKTGKPLPHNLRGKILKDIKPQLEAAYDAFKQRNGRYKVKEGSPIDDNSIEKYYYLSNGNLEESKRMMKDDGYDVN